MHDEVGVMRFQRLLLLARLAGDDRRTDDEIADGPRSVILEQVSNGIAVRSAVLELCNKAVRTAKA